MVLLRKKSGTTTVIKTSSNSKFIVIAVKALFVLIILFLSPNWSQGKKNSSQTDCQWSTEILKSMQKWSVWCISGGKKSKLREYLFIARLLQKGLWGKFIKRWRTWFWTSQMLWWMLLGRNTKHQSAATTEKEEVIKTCAVHSERSKICLLYYASWSQNGAWV